MATKSQLQKVNDWLHSVGPDGQHVRNRIADSLNIKLDSGKLSDRDRDRFREAVEKELGFSLKGLGGEIDGAGNANEPEGFGKQAKKWGPIAAGAAVTAFGIPGVMPGLLGGGGAAASASGASGAGSTAAGAAGVASAVRPTRDIVMDVLKAGGAGLAGYADAAASNRGTQFDADLAKAQLDQQAERDYQSAMQSREESARTNRRDAWELANRAAYKENAPKDLNTTKLSPYSRSVAGPSAEVRAAATGMRTDAERRLADPHADLPMPQRVGTDVELEDASGWEKAAGIGAGAIGVASAIPTEWWKRLAGGAWGRWSR